MSEPTPDPSLFLAYQNPKPHLKQSGPGIASFALGIAVCLIEAICIFAATYLVISRRGAAGSDSPEMTLAGLGICGGCFIALVGLILGIVGLATPDRKRLFAILGLVINAMILFGVIGLLILGTLRKHP